MREIAERSSIHSNEPTRRRVAPLAPDDRRAALVEATVPLLIENGSAISTRQIAQAAGVAEGTIFRVFPDKNSLILAAIRSALDPEKGERALRAIPADLELRERVTQAAAIMLAGLEPLRPAAHDRAGTHHRSGSGQRLRRRDAEKQPADPGRNG